MAYDFSLQDAEGPFTEPDGSHVVEFVLGFAEETDTIVVMSVMLVPTDKEDTLELCFGIRTKVGPDIEGVSPPDYSKVASDRYIPKAQKSNVLLKISEAVTRIVSATLPRHILMETFYANLPHQALKKYEVIGAEVIVCGYVVGAHFRDPATGINYWHFEKRI